MLGMGRCPHSVKVSLYNAPEEGCGPTSSLDEGLILEHIVPIDDPLICFNIKFYEIMF